MAEPLRHRQTKGAETDMPSLPPPRHIPTLPFCDIAEGFYSLCFCTRPSLLSESHNCTFWKAFTRLREVVIRAGKSSAADLCKAQVKRRSLSLLSHTRR